MARAEYFPAKQFVHDEAPVAENVPAGHDSHVWLLTLEANLPSWHDTHEVEPGESAKEPMGQLLQESCPDEAWNFPTSQSAHTEEPADAA